VIPRLPGTDVYVNAVAVMLPASVREWRFDKSHEGVGVMVDGLIINNFHTSCDSEPIHMVHCGAEFPLASLATRRAPRAEGD
jgi:hypothetical protein